MRANTFAANGPGCASSSTPPAITPNCLPGNCVSVTPGRGTVMVTVGDGSCSDCCGSYGGRTGCRPLVVLCLADGGVPFLWAQMVVLGRMGPEGELVGYFVWLFAPEGKRQPERCVPLARQPTEPAHLGIYLTTCLAFLFTNTSHTRH